MVIIHMKRIIIHFRGVKYHESNYYLFYRLCEQICILVVLHVYFSYTCVSTIDDTHPCMCRVQVHEKIELYELHYRISFYLRDLFPPIKRIAHAIDE